MKKDKKGYETLQPTMLGGISLWSTSKELVDHFKNLWKEQIKDIQKIKDNL